MLSLTPPQAYLVLLILTLPVCLWVIYWDLKFMKIPNKAVLAMMGIFLIVGPVVFPFEPWAWRWLNFVVVLVIGMILNAIANVGAGDAKFAAAAAPFVSASHLPVVLPLFAAFLLGAFFSHRIMRAIPAVRRLAPDWVSWGRSDFPMGLALAGTYLAYMGFASLPALY